MRLELHLTPLHVPGLVIGVDDIEITGLGSKFGRAKPAGPYLITSRDSGLALDTLKQSLGGRVGALPPVASPHQLWYVRPSGVKGQATIISATNALALDATREDPADPHPVMWELDGEQGQRWQLESTTDGIGFLVKAPHNGTYLTLTAKARDHLDKPWAPWFSNRTGDRPQQWIFSLPHGNL